MRYKSSSLKDLISFISKGIVPKYANSYDENVIRVINQRCNRNGEITFKEARYSDLSKRKVTNEKLLKNKDILINSTGKGTAGRVAQISENQLTEPTTVDGHMIIIRPSEKIDPDYLGYALKAQQRVIESYAEGSTGQTEINKQRLLDETIIKYPSKEEQRKIANIFINLDMKIKNNQKINTNLEEINKLYFSNIFKNTTNFIKASDIAEIKIGKTPPRKEKKWFSSEKGQIWVSIKDMNGSGSFILDSSEYLINNATNNFNIQKVSKNTVILSFKLTIGRVKITEQDMFTNEAIAQFKNAKLPFQFLYTYLKSFPYETLGSTSSIAKSINSKIVKNIPILHPEKYELDNYMSFAEPIFKEIELHQLENKKLLSIKDELLHRFFN